MPPAETAKARILNAAVLLSEARSVQLIQLRDVAKAAGVSSSLVVFHFKSLQDLMVEVRLKRWEDLGVSALAEWLKENPDAGVEALLHQYLTRDLENGHRSRDLMAMSWWWSCNDEARFQALLVQRIEPVRAALKRTYPKIDACELEAAVALIHLAYIGMLREAHTARMSPRDAIDKLMVILKPVLASHSRQPV